MVSAQTLSNIEVLPRTPQQKSENKDPYLSLFRRVSSKDDLKAFEAIYKDHYLQLFNFARKLLSHQETAEEVLADVFLKLWKNRKKINITSSFNSYIFTSLRNACYDHLRALKKYPKVDDEVLLNYDGRSTDPFSQLTCRELQEKIDRAVNMLPKDRKRIFLMSREEGLKYKEIAERLQISIKTVETQMGRSLKHLREYLKNDLVHL